MEIAISISPVYWKTENVVDFPQFLFEVNVILTCTLSFWSGYPKFELNGYYLNNEDFQKFKKPTQRNQVISSKIESEYIIFSQLFPRKSLSKTDQKRAAL